jgi:TPR repeat protein
LDFVSPKELFQAGRNWLLGWGNNTLDLHYARMYLERATKLEHEEATWMLELMERSSSSLPKDDDERCVWLQGLFTDESPRAMFYRAWYARDRTEAMALLRRAMVEIPTAAARLGLMLSFDTCAEALALYVHAANKSDFLGLGCLANCFEYGTGVEVDMIHALELYKCAAEQGDIESMKVLADKFRYDQPTHLRVKWLAKYVILGDSSSESAISDIFREPLARLDCGQLDGRENLSWLLICLFGREMLDYEKVRPKLDRHCHALVQQMCAIYRTISCRARRAAVHTILALRVTAIGQDVATKIATLVFASRMTHGHAWFYY